MMSSRVYGLVGAALLLVAAAPADQDIALRPQVGKPLQAAQRLITQHKFPQALAQIKKAEAAAPLSAEEKCLAAQLRGTAAEAEGDTATAVAAFETAIATGKLAAPDQLRLIETEASLSYQVKDYAKTISWAKQYQDAGGKDEATRTLLAQAYYLTGDWADAATALKAQIAAGATIGEPQLRLLADSEFKQNKTADYQAALEKLVTAYPRPEYWTSLVRSIQAQPDFPHRLTLDVYRLSLAVGVLSSPAQYVDAAELALEDSLPGEAKTFLDQGFAAGVLGSGPAADRQGRLRAMAAQQSADDLKTIDQRAAAATDGAGLVDVGLDYLGHGQPQKAVLLIQQGLTKGDLKHPEEARLHLGLAYYAAGQKDKSLQAFRSVQDGDAAELARLWVIHCGVRSS
jgi:hypothetical protein